MSSHTGPLRYQQQNSTGDQCKDSDYRRQRHTLAVLCGDLQRTCINNGVAIGPEHSTPNERHDSDPHEHQTYDLSD